MFERLKTLPVNKTGVFTLTLEPEFITQGLGER